MPAFADSVTHLVSLDRTSVIDSLLYLFDFSCAFCGLASTSRMEITVQLSWRVSTDSEVRVCRWHYCYDRKLACDWGISAVEPLLDLTEVHSLHLTWIWHIS